MCQIRSSLTPGLRQCVSGLACTDFRFNEVNKPFLSSSDISSLSVSTSLSNNPTIDHSVHDFGHTTFIYRKQANRRCRKVVQKLRWSIAAMPRSPIGLLSDSQTDVNNLKKLSTKTPYRQSEGYKAQLSINRSSF